MKNQVLDCLIAMTDLELTFQLVQDSHSQGLKPNLNFDETDFVDLGFIYAHIFSAAERPLPACIAHQLARLEALTPIAKAGINHGVNLAQEHLPFLVSDDDESSDESSDENNVIYAAFPRYNVSNACPF